MIGGLEDLGVTIGVNLQDVVIVHEWLPISH
jgi:hypothetical protein